MQALILAGGRGMRLSPLTDHLPKSLLDLPGGTFLDYLMHHLSLLPTSEAAMVLQYRGDQIARHLADHDHLLLIPQHAPFTLLGALASAAPWVREQTLVLHDNFYFSQPLHYFIEGADPRRPAFLIPPQDMAEGALERCGAYLLPPDALRVAQSLTHADHSGALFKALAAEGMEPMLVPLQGWAHRVRRPTDLLIVNRYLLTHWHDLIHPPGAGIGYDALHFNWIAPDADVDQAALGLFVTVTSKASVHHSRLHNTLVLPGVDLHDSTQKNVVLASDAGSLLSFYATAP